jgi:chemotaxis signal transduction protein
MSLPPQTGVNQIAIIRRDQMTIGVVVDAVSEVAGVPKSSVMAMPAELGAKDPAVRSRSRFIKAVIRREDGVAALLDIDRLIEAIRLS